MVAKLQIEIAGGTVHFRGFAESGCEAEAAAAVARAIAQLLGDPALLAEAFDVEPAVLAKYLANRPAERKPEPQGVMLPDVEGLQ